MPSNREYLYTRGFLNQPRHESIGLYLAEVRREDHTDGTAALEADLTIGDCFRAVTITCGLHDEPEPGQVENVLSKARQLRDIVTEFCSAVETAVAEYPHDEPRHERATD